MKEKVLDLSARISLVPKVFLVVRGKALGARLLQTTDDESLCMVVVFNTKGDHRNNIAFFFPPCVCGLVLTLLVRLLY